MIPRIFIVGAVRYLFRVLLVGYLVVNLYGTEDSINGDQLKDLKDVVCGKYTSMTELEKMSAGVVDVEEPCGLFVGEDGESRYLHEEARDIDYTLPNGVSIKTVIRAADVRGKWFREVLGFVRDLIARKGTVAPMPRHENRHHIGGVSMSDYTVAELAIWNSPNEKTPPHGLGDFLECWKITRKGGDLLTRTAKEWEAARQSAWTLALKLSSTHSDRFREELKRPSRCDVDQYPISWQGTRSICFELVDLDRHIKGMDKREFHDDVEEYSGLDRHIKGMDKREFHDDVEQYSGLDRRIKGMDKRS